MFHSIKLNVKVKKNMALPRHFSTTDSQMKVLDFNPESLAPDDYCSTWEAVVRFLDGVFASTEKDQKR